MIINSGTINLNPRMPSEGHKLLIGVFRRRWRGPIKNAANFSPYWLQPVRVVFFLLSDSKDSQKIWAEVGSRRRVNTYICKMKRVTSLILELVTKFTMKCINSHNYTTRNYTTQNYTKIHQIDPYLLDLFSYFILKA